MISINGEPVSLEFLATEIRDEIDRMRGAYFTLAGRIEALKAEVIEQKNLRAKEAAEALSNIKNLMDRLNAVKKQRDEARHKLASPFDAK